MIIWRYNRQKVFSGIATFIVIFRTSNSNSRLNRKNGVSYKNEWLWQGWQFVSVSSKISSKICEIWERNRTMVKLFFPRGFGLGHSRPQTITYSANTPNCEISTGDWNRVWVRETKISKYFTNETWQNFGPKLFISKFDNNDVLLCITLQLISIKLYFFSVGYEKRIIPSRVINGISLTGVITEPA